MAGKKYVFDPKMKDRTTHAAPPTYKRAEGGRFTYNEKLSQKDLEYLFKVLKLPWVTETTTRATNKIEPPKAEK